MAKPTSKTKRPAKAETKEPVKGFDQYVEGGPGGLSKSDETAIELSSPKSAMSVYSDTPELGADDVFIPKLRLAQGLTAEVQNGTAKPGQWLMTGSDAASSVTIVPVMMKKRRELRSSEGAREVECRSMDGVTGEGTPGGPCAECPLSKWSEGPGGKNRPPVCTFIYSYLVYVVDSASFGILEFYRTSEPAGRMLNTLIVQKGLKNFAVDLTSKGQTGPRGTYYSPILIPAKFDEGVAGEVRQSIQNMFG